MFNTFNFIQLCVASERELRSQETQFMLRKIEAEALEEDTLVTNDQIENTAEIDSENVSLADEINGEIDVYTGGSKQRECQRNFKLVDKYSCEKCLLSFNNKTKYNKHIKIHDDAKQLKCHHCPQVFLKQIHLNVHLRSHIKKEDRKYVCNNCGEHFLFEFLLKQHSFKHSVEKPFLCKKCGKGKPKNN